MSNGCCGVLQLVSEIVLRLKGGVRITEEHVLISTLLPNYYICKKLGEGRSGKVFLAYHRILSDYRAIKVVPGTMTDYETFRKEALFLKHLRHPGIPLVYDVVEGSFISENYFILVEEYLEGESIFESVKKRGKYSVKTTVELGIQICRIIQFMNTAENPILYLDLQPKNLLVCDKMVKLIDFDHAQYASEVEDFGERYGTVGFAAPEQFKGEPLDCRTDVYAIGALLYFMCRGRIPGRIPEFGEDAKFRELDRIIRGCMAEQKDDRYATAQIVEMELEEYLDRLSKEQAIESLTVIFMGAKAGIGTTHAALGFTNFLTRNGYLTLYQELYDTDTVRTFARFMGANADENGVFHFGCLNICPYYGKSVKMPYHHYPIIIRDLGVSWKDEPELPEADLYVLVSGAKWWEIDPAVQAVNKLKSGGKQMVLLWNHTSGGFCAKLPRDLRGISCLNLPFFTNPLKKNKTVDACFTKLLAFRTGGTTGWKRKRFRELFRRRKPG